MKTTSKSKINVIIFFTILLTLGLWMPSRFAFTRTKSLNHRLFYIASYSAGDRIAKDDHIMFKSEHHLITPLARKAGTNTIIKVVACPSGSILQVKGLEYYCDSQLIGRAVEKTPSGVKIDHFTYDGIIPDGKFFVMGRSSDSLDSRYIGFVDAEDIVGFAHPII